MLTIEKAERYLSPVDPQYNFWVFQGSYLTSIYDLHHALEEMRDDQFSYHVNQDKNDFSNWIRNIICDRSLARELLKVKTKKTMSKKIKNRIAKLEGIIHDKERG